MFTGMRRQTDIKVKEIGHTVWPFIPRTGPIKVLHQDNIELGKFEAQEVKCTRKDNRVNRYVKLTQTSCLLTQGDKSY